MKDGSSSCGDCHGRSQLEGLEVQRSSCRESTWRSGGNSSCHLNKMMLWDLTEGPEEQL
jgi:hypothetical protein